MGLWDIFKFKSLIENKNDIEYKKPNQNKVEKVNKSFSNTSDTKTFKEDKIETLPNQNIQEVTNENNFQKKSVNKTKEDEKIKWKNEYENWNIEKNAENPTDKSQLTTLNKNDIEKNDLKSSNDYNDKPKEKLNISDEDKSKNNTINSKSKYRIFDIARRLDTQSKSILNFLKQNNIDVKSHMSNVDELTYKMILKTYTSGNKSTKYIPKNIEPENKLISINKFDTLIHEVHYCNDLFHLARDLEEPFSNLGKYWKKRKNNVQRKIIEDYPNDVDITRDKDKTDDDNFKYVLIRKVDKRNCCHVDTELWHELKGI